MPLTSAALTTYATASAAIGGSPTQATVERLINAASDAMARIANRTFQYEASITERHKGEGTYRLMLKRTPISSITSIVLLDIEGNVATTFASTDYEIEDAAQGFVWRAGGWISTAQDIVGMRSMVLPGTERKSIRVIYTGGWVTPQQDADDVSLTRDLPYDLEEACIAATVHMYRNASRDKTLASQTTDNSSKAWYQGSKSFLPPEVVQIARSYWRPS